ncbi:RICIN domain-containing protein [Streptomyces erythrochromogenes]|uniref:RICIN domain-containing protein n=1 Tax=Streptomyces erythrochromogenes TaxID=285574 RepID=UPI0036C95305
MQIPAVRQWALAATAAAVATLFVTTPAQAGVQIFHFDGQNNVTRRCLDDSLEFGLRTFQCNGGDFQQFRHSDGVWSGERYYYELRNKVTGRCIDDSFAYGLRPFVCNKKDFQQWSVSKNDRGTTFKNRATGRCIDDSFEFGLRAYECNGGDFQKWWGVHPN